MGTNSPRKPHVVCVPFQAQGHVNPFMQLAKLLHLRGYFITFVNTEFNHRRLLRSNGPDWANGFPGFQFETITEGLPYSDRDATQDPVALCSSIKKHCLASFRDLLTRLGSSEKSPPVTCIISDGVMSFALRAAEEFGVPEVQFWTASACGFMGYLQYQELIDKGIVPFEDKRFLSDGTLDTPIEWVPGMRNIRLRDFPSFIRTTDNDDIMLKYLESEAQNCLKASAIIFNTFNTLEVDVVQAIASKFPSIYTIGPLSLQPKHVPSHTQVQYLNSSLWKEDKECLKWLDKWAPGSVIYVNYGSVTVMTNEHLIEFAWGLANSNHPFLWIVRPDIVMGESRTLPEELLDDIKNRGMLASWCPQQTVLSHPSIGVFLTHCGWNSTLESISSGVPMVCWPFFAEQQTNCRYACAEWGIGLEVDQDVKREEIERLMKEVMEGDKGKEMREKAMEWKRKAKEATDVGGSSYSNFDRLIKEVFFSGVKYEPLS